MICYAKLCNVVEKNKEAKTVTMYAKLNLGKKITILDQINLPLL